MFVAQFQFRPVFSRQHLFTQSVPLVPCLQPGAPPVWPNLPLLAAGLVQAGVVELDELLGHLAPADEDIRKVGLHGVAWGRMGAHGA